MITVHDLDIGTITDTVIIKGIETEVTIKIDRDDLCWEDIMGDYDGEINCKRKSIFDVELPAYRDTYYFHIDMDYLLDESKGDIEKAKDCYKQSYLTALDYVQDDMAFVHVSVTIDVYGHEISNGCGGYIMYFFNNGRGETANKYLVHEINDLINMTVSEAECYIIENWQPKLTNDL